MRAFCSWVQDIVHPTDLVFLDFVSKCLEYDPRKRLRAEDAVNHPLFTRVRGLKTVPTPQLSGRPTSSGGQCRTFCELVCDWRVGVGFGRSCGARFRCQRRRVHRMGMPSARTPHMVKLESCKPLHTHAQPFARRCVCPLVPCVLCACCGAVAAAKPRGPDRGPEAHRDAPQCVSGASGTVTKGHGYTSTERRPSAAGDDGDDDYQVRDLAAAEEEGSLDDGRRGRARPGGEPYRRRPGY